MEEEKEGRQVGGSQARSRTGKKWNTTFLNVFQHKPENPKKRLDRSRINVDFFLKKE